MLLSLFVNWDVLIVKIDHAREEKIIFLFFMSLTFYLTVQAYLIFTIRRQKQRIMIETLLK